MGSFYAHFDFVQSDFEIGTIANMENSAFE